MSPQSLKWWQDRLAEERQRVRDLGIFAAELAVRLAVCDLEALKEACRVARKRAEEHRPLRGAP